MTKSGEEIILTKGLTRQTFYRNFLDKYDLINWYFDKLLVKSFEHMGRGRTVYDALVKINSGNDTLAAEGKEQLSAYVQTCLRVKAEYPKPA